MYISVARFICQLRERRRFSIQSLSIVFLLLSSVAFESCSDKTIPQNKRTQQTAFNLSPIYQADPSIFYYKGTYYLYGTNGKDANNGFTAYTSRDLKNWELKGPVLVKGEVFGDRGFWAPQVWEYRGVFYMAYTANERIAIAKSNSPLGPFRQEIKEPLMSDFRQIDPFLFIDNDGKKYLYHVRLDRGNHIYVAEMTDDFSRIKPETYKECISATPRTWEYMDSLSVGIAEGPTVIKKKGLYYLFYSVNDFRNKNYAVGYATSTNVYGPWARYPGNPIIDRKVTGQPGNGHGDIVTGKGNKMYYVFHTHHSETVVAPRKTAIISLKEVKNEEGKDVFAADKETFRYLEAKTKN
jgi:beta-xylosidase